ncbi:Protein TRM32 [Vitis vinifera]|uniref:Protein TRM32 n=1 Tax=Vitis vinifera TaxID=29760 RepID=A0A438HSE9_VITVI|nr:Protein TRM32 [Vitis vinifera]
MGSDCNLWYHPWAVTATCGSFRVANPGKNINISNADEVQECIVAEMDKSQIEKQMMKSSQTTKSSGKARIKALIAKDVSKRKGQHHRNSTHPTRSQLLRTESIHRLEYADRDPLADIILNDESPSSHQNNENSSDTSTTNVMQASDPEEQFLATKIARHVAPQESSDKPTQALSAQKLLYATEPSGVPPSKEFLDALCIINMNREFFLKIVQDPESPWAYHFHHQWARGVKSGLSKSGSFPVPGPSGGRDFGPIELKYNQNEITSHARSESKLQAGGQTQNLAEFESTEDVSEQSKFGITDDSSLGLPHHFKRWSENQVAIRRFKDLKQKIKHAIRQSKKERHRIIMDAIFHKVPHGHRFSKDAKKQIADQWKEPATSRNSEDSPGSSYGWGHSEPALSKQTSFPSKSLEKYTQLFESSFNKEAKYQISERLKVRTEDVGLPCGSDPKSLRRILSLPDFKSYFGLQSEDSGDNYLSEMAVNTVRIQSDYDEQKSLELPLGSENHVQFDAIGESKKHLVEASETYPVKQDQVRPTSATDAEVNAADWTNDDLGDVTKQDTTFYQGQGIRTTKKFNANLSEPSPISVLDSNVREDLKFQDIVSPGKLPISEDSELESRRPLYEGPDSAVNQQHESSMDSPTVVESRFDVEKVDLRKHLDSDFFPVQVDIKNKAEFNYVRDVLELSGIIRNELLETWHSIDKLVDPSVFEEVEGCLPLEPECSGNEEDGSCSHLLLFDLINEVLMEIYERSLTYCPRHLSSLSHIRPMPVGYHVLEEVWANISWYFSWEPDPDQTLDYVVSRDLAKGDGWMNLQFEAECLGLELEDWIFDDLLDELLCT